MGDASVQQEKKVVLVTGFGPFKSHEINASWCAVQALQKLGLPEEYELVILEVPVEYAAVDDVVPKLWENYKPHLAVHVGVSGIARNLTLEQYAYNDGVTMEDVKGCIPSTQCCIQGEPKQLDSGLQMNIVCEEINQGKSGVTSVVSHDPGRYLCNYIYYKSLHVDRTRTAFVHVPTLGNPYTDEELALGLRSAIMEMLLQIS